MRPAVFIPCLVSALALLALTGCDGCRGEQGPSAEERTNILASAIATPPPSIGQGAESMGHAANVIPGEGPRRIEFQAPRAGMPMPILPGQGIGPIRFGATKQTIERLMGAPCDDATETLCRYVGRAVDFKLTAGVVTEIRISRKGREAKRDAAGSILEYGFFNGAILPDLYFGMQPAALQEQLGAPQKIEKISPMGADGFSERHVYDGMALEYDLWSSDKLVLGAAVLTKSETAAAANQKALDALAAEAAKQAELMKKTKPMRVPH